MGNDIQAYDIHMKNWSGLSYFPPPAAGEDEGEGNFLCNSRPLA